jgi:hypothetical protein
MRILLAAILLTAVSACQTSPEPGDTSRPAADTVATDVPDDGPIEFRTDRSRYGPEDMVGLAFANHGDITYAFNPCTRTVERDTDGEWERVEEPDRVCTMEAWLIEPGATRTAETDLPGMLAEGRYRLVVVFTPDVVAPQMGQVLAVSEPFAVRS